MGRGRAGVARTATNGRHGSSPGPCSLALLPLQLRNSGRSAAGIPGVDAATPLVAVSRTGFDRIAAPIRQIEPDEILAAFPAD